jgi:hypothetical protein
VPTATERRGELLKIAELAVQHSEGRLRLVHNEEDSSRKQASDAAHFLKFDEKRFCRDIELYGLMGDGPVGWEQTLPIFLVEVILPLKKILPASYTKASEALREVGTSVYSGDILQSWRKLF